jgi:recombinational DNA repair protein (RecF pathway)
MSKELWNALRQAGKAPHGTKCVECKTSLPDDKPAPFYAVLYLPGIEIYYPLCHECVEAESRHKVNATVEIAV